MWTQKKAAIFKYGRRVSQETKFADTLIMYFQPARLSHTGHDGHFVRAVPAN